MKSTPTEVRNRTFAKLNSCKPLVIATTVTTTSNQKAETKSGKVSVRKCALYLKPQQEGDVAKDLLNFL